MTKDPRLLTLISQQKARSWEGVSWAQTFTEFGQFVSWVKTRTCDSCLTRENLPAWFQTYNEGTKISPKPQCYIRTMKENSPSTSDKNLAYGHHFPYFIFQRYSTAFLPEISSMEGMFFGELNPYSLSTTTKVATNGMSGSQEKTWNVYTNFLLFSCYTTGLPVTKVTVMSLKGFTAWNNNHWSYGQWKLKKDS